MFPVIGINLRVFPESTKMNRRRPRGSDRNILRQLSKWPHQSIKQKEKRDLENDILAGRAKAILFNLNNCSSESFVFYHAA